MAESSPSIIILAGPNGAGKTTASRSLLADALQVMTFVNADVIAQGLAGFAPDSAAIEASRIMLERMHVLAERKENFAFETTLAGRSYVPWLKALRQAGYSIHLTYFWLNSPELAVTRVAARVRMGGHGIPEATIRQRYQRSIQNFFRLYQPLVTTWQVYDNSQVGKPELIAFGEASDVETVINQATWMQIKRIS